MDLFARFEQEQFPQLIKMFALRRLAAALRVHTGKTYIVPVGPIGIDVVRHWVALLRAPWNNVMVSTALLHLGAYLGPGGGCRCFLGPTIEKFKFASAALSSIALAWFIVIFDADRWKFSISVCNPEALFV